MTVRINAASVVYDDGIIAPPLGATNVQDAVDAIKPELAAATTNNGTTGRAVLVGGTLVVDVAAVSATSDIFLTSQVDGGAPGWLRVSARTPGVSFTILSSSGTDTSTVAWLLRGP